MAEIMTCRPGRGDRCGRVSGGACLHHQPELSTDPARPGRTMKSLNALLPPHDIRGGSGRIGARKASGRSNCQSSLCLGGEVSGGAARIFSGWTWFRVAGSERLTSTFLACILLLKGRYPRTCTGGTMGGIRTAGFRRDPQVTRVLDTQP